MRRKRQWMLVAILTCGLGLLVTSCSERDELEAGSASAAARAAEKQQLVGEWCVEYKESGSVESSKGDMSYTSVIERYLFKEDGTGLWARYFLSDESVYPVAEWGGSGSGVFSYAIGNGGELAIHFLPENPYHPEAFVDRTVSYVDGVLTGSGMSNQELSYKPANDIQVAAINEWDGRFNVPAGDAQPDDGQEGDDQDGQTDDEGQVDDDDIGVKSSYRIYGVGYGYNFTRDRTQAISMVPILDPEYVKKNNLRHSSGIQAKMTDNSYTGHSLNEVANNFAATANLGGGIFGFKGEVGASFGVSKTTSSEHEYALSVIDATVTNVVLEAREDEIVKHLVPNFMAQLAGEWDGYKGREGMKRLINTYGTHFVLQAEVGGCVRYATTVDMSKVNGDFSLDAYAKMSYSRLGFSASASVENRYKNSYENSSDSRTTKLSVLGGSPEAVSALFKDPNGENLKEWAATLPLDNFKNTVVTKVVSSIPLWELLVGPKYAERAKELEEYVTSGAYELDMKNEYDFGIGDIGKIKSVSSLFSKEDDASGTLVKDLIVDQKVVARACKEFIPQLSTTELCIVLYPMVENKPKYNLGYFVGNRSNAPCRVCWNDSTAAAKITRLAREKTKGIRETLYILGCSFLNEELDQKTIQTGLLRDVTKDEVYMLSQKTYVEKQKGQNVYVAKDHKYPLIKLFNHVWTRENFSYYGKDDKGNVDCKVDNESGEIYYAPKFVTTDACRERIPLGWRLPRTTEFEQLVAEMKDKGVQQPARTLGIGGVTGFNAQWTDYWENNQTKPHTEKQSAHFWGYEYDSKKKAENYAKPYYMKLDRETGNVLIKAKSTEFLHSVRLIEDVKW